MDSAYSGKVMTVKGAVDPAGLGITLPHEHVMVDFIGAEKTGRHRYDPTDVVETMLPYLSQLPGLGIRGFVDCTPAYLARDVDVLLQLSEQTGLHIVTNTGQYKEPFLPKKTIETTSSELAALEILEILERNEVDPHKWIFIHAQNESDFDLLRIAADRGAWIEIDGIGEGREEQNLTPLLKLLDNGFDDRLLISQDAGWFTVGEEPGAKKRPFTFLHERFIPLMRRYGVDDDLIRALTIAKT